MINNVYTYNSCNAMCVCSFQRPRNTQLSDERRYIFYGWWTPPRNSPRAYKLAILNVSSCVSLAALEHARRRLILGKSWLARVITRQRRISFHIYDFCATASVFALVLGVLLLLFRFSCLCHTQHDDDDDVDGSSFYAFWQMCVIFLMRTANSVQQFSSLSILKSTV